MDTDFLKQHPFSLDDEDTQWVIQTFQGLSNLEKLGQIHIPLLLDTSNTSIEKNRKHSVGGVHIPGALPGSEREKILSAFKKQIRVPLFVTGDIEFGSIGSLPDSPTFPPQMGAAAAGEDSAAILAEAAAIHGRSQGFNWNFAPVADIVFNFRSSITGPRAFSSDPEIVMQMTCGYVRKLQSLGMAACLKHWPGDGVDSRDQHMVTSCNSLSMDEWRKSFGSVYKAAIDQGVLSIMSAHIALPAYFLDLPSAAWEYRHVPASINPYLNNRLLREDLGFNGLIISDATPMAGLTSCGPWKEVLPRVIQNGCDMFLFSNGIDRDMSIMKSAIETGQLTKDRLNEAVLRVLAMKAALKLHKEQESEPVELSTHREHIEIKRHKMVEKSITLVKDDQNILPISPKSHGRILLIENYEDVPQFSCTDKPFSHYLERAGFSVDIYTEETIVDPDLYDLILYGISQIEQFGHGEYFIKWGELHHGMIKSMQRFWHEIPTIMISFYNPFHLFDAPEVKTYINTYHVSDTVYSVLVEKLLGKQGFTGRFPAAPVDDYCG
ncbi:MAG: glycoside hydrolase family 3 protein [Spirochaetia bacterium]